MNGDAIMEKEIGEIIDKVQSDKHIAGCKAHDAITTGLVKAIRISESNHNLLKWLIVLNIIAIGSNILKAGMASDFFVTMLKAMIGI